MLNKYQQEQLKKHTGFFRGRTYADRALASLDDVRLRNRGAGGLGVNFEMAISEGKPLPEVKINQQPRVDLERVPLVLATQSP
jgi:hypothetical protein